MRRLAQSSAALGVAAIALLFLSLVLYAPKLRLGGGTIFYGRTIQADMSLAAELAAVRAENQRLQEALKTALMAAVTSEKDRNRGQKEPEVESNSEDPTLVQVDLLEFLGASAYMSGVSYDPYVCFPPLEEVFPNSTDQVATIKERLLQDLKEALAKIHNVLVDDIDVRKPYHKQEFNAGRLPTNIDKALRPLVTDPAFQTWRETITYIAARYMCDTRKRLHVACEGAPEEVDPALLGTYCPEVPGEEALERLGYFMLPFTSPVTITNNLMGGTCFTHLRNKRLSFAHWMVEERLDPEWRTFKPDNPEQDKVLLMFDMLYEKLLVFTQQYWMGVVTMQNPFDMYSIQDIIYTTRPDLIIETGTANGGSAVLWSGIMELVGLEDSKIITIDVSEPAWDPGANWGGAVIAREDPTQNRMWKKRVTFIKGYTGQQGVIDQIRKAVEGKKSVLVMLDSGHDKVNVAMELATYCPFVTVGSYCIVEDTKMSRWHSTGPLDAVKEFLTDRRDFEADRKRELFYSHHPMGYLKRVS